MQLGLGNVATSTTTLTGGSSTAGEGTALRVCTTADGGSSIQGLDGSPGGDAIGVFGNSPGGHAIWGISATGYGVYGSSQSTGVWGQGGQGVHGRGTGPGGVGLSDKPAVDQGRYLHPDLYENGNGQPNEALTVGPRNTERHAPSWRWNGKGRSRSGRSRRSVQGSSG